MTKKSLNIEILKEFIFNNKLEFNSGSGGDINILALCGYACYIEAEVDDCIEAVNSPFQDVNDEINRVYNYAHKNFYEKFWKTELAKKTYKF